MSNHCLCGEDCSCAVAQFAGLGRVMNAEDIAVVARPHSQGTNVAARMAMSPICRSEYDCQWLCFVQDARTLTGIAVVENVDRCQAYAVGNR